MSLLGQYVEVITILVYLLLRCAALATIGGGRSCQAVSLGTGFNRRRRVMLTLDWRVDSNRLLSYCRRNVYTTPRFTRCQQQHLRVCLSASDRMECFSRGQNCSFQHWLSDIHVTRIEPGKLWNSVWWINVVKLQHKSTNKLSYNPYHLHTDIYTSFLNFYMLRFVSFCL